MRNMKTLLRLMGAAALTTVAASSVVACGTQSDAPQLNEKYAILLDWVDATSKASKIQQKLNIDSTAGKEKVSIDADNAMIITTNLFKDKLLIAGSAASKFKAKDVDAAKFLVDLGFKSGSTTADYSDNEVSAITALVGKVTRSDAGKIEENGTTDFKVAAGTCQVSIMSKSGDEAKIVKSYTIKTLANDTLNVPNIVSNLVLKENLDFTKEKGYVQGRPVLTSLLWKNDKSAEKNKYNSFVKLFGPEKLIWSATSGGTAINSYPTTGNAYLTIKFGNIKVLAALDCGPLPSPA